MIESVCDHCSWRVPTAHYVDRDGRAARLCNRCLDRAAELRDAVARIRGMGDRMRARERQYRRLEEENEQLRDRLARALREVEGLRRRDAGGDTAEYAAGEASR